MQDNIFIHFCTLILYYVWVRVSDGPVREGFLHVVCIVLGCPCTCWFMVVIQPHCWTESACPVYPCLKWCFIWHKALPFCSAVLQTTQIGLSSVNGMGGCQGKSALGVDDVEYSKKPRPPKPQKKQNGKRKYSKSSIHTYPIDIPVLVHDRKEVCHSSQHNGHVGSEEKLAQEIAQALPEPDFPSYGPQVARSDSCDPDTPQPCDAESSFSCGCESPEIDSPFVDESETRCIPPSDSGIYSLSQSSQDTTPTSASCPHSQGPTPGAIPEEMPLTPRDTSTPTEPELCTSSTQTVGSSSLDEICDAPDRRKPTNLPVKRFLSHQGLPPQRPQSESRFSFKRLRKRKGGAGKTGIRGSWKSQDSFDISSMLKTGLSRTNSECSEMCLCDELYSIQAPLAQFDSILTMDSPSCGSLNRLPHNRSVDNVIDAPSAQLTCSVCKGDNSSLNTSTRSHPPSQRNSWTDQHG